MATAAADSLIVARIFSEALALDPAQQGAAWDWMKANYRPHSVTAEEREQYLDGLRAELRFTRALALRDLKFKALKDDSPITLTAARRYVAQHTNYLFSLSVILGLRPFMARPGWLALLGESWESYFCVWRYIDELRAALPATGPVLEMMTARGRARYAALPESLTIYRGCGSEERIGICWSLRREIAEKFRTFPGYGPVGRPILLTATVDKADVLAVKLDRDEDEVITFGAKVIASTTLAEPRTPETVAVTFNPRTS